MLNYPWKDNKPKMQIRKVTLVNFQNHKTFEMEPSSGITSIQGESDQGKSAVLRAIRWVCLNDFKGEDFIRDGAKSTEILVETKAHLILRRRGSKENSYALDGEEFKAFGSNVPEPIQRLLRLSELNFQSQHDSPFWFAETAGEVSRQLNSIIDLTVIDTSLGYIASEVRSAQDRTKMTKERLTVAELKLSELEPQRARIEQFEKVQSCRKFFRRAYKDSLELVDILDKIKTNNAEALAEQAEEVSTLYLQARRVRNVQSKENDLDELLRNIELQKELSQGPPLQEFQLLRTEAARCRNLATDEQKLRTLVFMIEESQEQVSRKYEAAIKLEREFHEQTKGEKCPMCGQTIE